MKILLTIACGILACAASPAAERPNILLIFADDIGYEALNCYGGLDFETPNLNRMAEQGMRFSRSYTSPICTPSRVSLHTGLYTNRHGHVNVLPVNLGTDKAVDFQKFPTFARQTRANGYQTSLTGKWQLATIEKHPDHIRNAGFDSWCVWQIWKDGKKTGRHWNATLNDDGKFRLFRNSGKLIDARALPLEKPADADDPDAIAAKVRLQAIFQKITPDGPRPPLPFPAVPQH
jgi:arylsulfatase A-like enzyme